MSHTSKPLVKSLNEIKVNLTVVLILCVYDDTQYTRLESLNILNDTSILRKNFEFDY